MPWKPSARGVEHGEGFLRRLDAVDGLLHHRVEVLHAEAHAVETELAQQPDRGGIGLARVDLDRVLALVVIAQGEALAGGVHQTAHLIKVEEGRRAAAPVQLVDEAVAVHVAGDQIHLLFQQVEVGRGARAILGDDLVAGAVVTDGVAERDVEVERQRAAKTVAARQRLAELRLAELVGELHGGGVGGVARAGGVVALDEIGVEDEVLVHIESAVRSIAPCPCVIARPMGPWRSIPPRHGWLPATAFGLVAKGTIACNDIDAAGVPLA